MRRVRRGRNPFPESDCNLPIVLSSLGASRHSSILGCASLAAGEHARTIEKFDAAIEIYRSHEAGTRFIDYVIADKMRAQGSNPTHSALKPR